MKHTRVFYAILFLLLFFIETLIALFLHDDFIRPYVGDVLVMFVLYTLLRALLPVRIWEKLHTRRISLWIPILFCFALVVEILQGIHIVELLGLGGNAVARTMIGTSFDWGDLICYFVGCVFLCIWEWFTANKNIKKNS